MITESQKITAAILQELEATPEGYTQPAAALTASVRLLVVPEPDDAAVAEALLRLEHERFIVRVDTVLSGVRYAITPAGRAALRG